MIYRSVFRSNVKDPRNTNWPSVINKTDYSTAHLSLCPSEVPYRTLTFNVWDFSWERDDSLTKLIHSLLRFNPPTRRLSIIFHSLHSTLNFSLDCSKWLHDPCPHYSYKFYRRETGPGDHWCYTSRSTGCIVERIGWRHLFITLTFH